MKNFLRRLNPFAATLRDPTDEMWRALLGKLASSAGVTVTPLSACGVATVYACVNRHAGSIASVPLEVMRRTADTVTKATDLPLYDLLHNEPNDEMSSVDFRRTLQSQLTLRNAAYAAIVRDGFGQPVELHPIDNKDIYPDRNAARQLVYVLDGKTVAKENILHLRRGPMCNGIVAPDLMSVVRDVIGLAIVLQDNAAKFFANGSRPGAVLETPNALSDRAFKRVKESFEKVHRGTDKAYAIAILEEGLKYVAQRTDNTDSQFVESRKQQDIAICQALDMQPHKVGLLDRATFSNIEQQSIEYVMDGVLPNALIWESTLNRMLLTPEQRRAGYYVKFNLAGLLRGDLKSRYEAYALGRMWGWLSANDVRVLEELNPISGGDDYLYPANQNIVGQPPAAGQTAGATARLLPAGRTPEPAT